MAHFTSQAGLDDITGALSKRKDQERLSITRRKPVKDPLTGEVVGHGPKEMFMQNWRNYDENPRTEKEEKQHSKWTEACRLAPLIFKDKHHPRFMEMYTRWQEHVKSSETPKQFPNFVRSVLASE